MFVTNHAKALYRGIEKYGGGSIREMTLRCEAGAISHGTFVAARQELCELGLIAIERIARKPHYELINPALADALIAESDAIYAAGPVAVWNAKQAAKKSKLAREFAKSDNDTDNSGSGSAPKNAS